MSEGTDRERAALEQALAALRRRIAELEASLAKVLSSRSSRAELEGDPAFLREVIDAVPGFIGVQDSSGRYLLANSTLARSAGLAPREMIGKRDLDIYPDKEKIARLLDEDAEVIRRREPRIVPRESVTYPDGSVHWHTGSKVPLIAPDGSCDRLLFVTAEITELVRSEAALRERDEQLRLIAENMVDAIIQVDGERRVTYVSPSVTRMVGWRADEMAGRPLSDFTHPEDLDRVRAEVAYAIEQNLQSHRIEYRALRSDGTPVWVESELRLLSGGGMIITSRDIGQRKSMEQERVRLERQLLHAQRLESIGVLAGGVAHDFNNLLAAILGNLEIAVLDVAPSSDARVEIERAVSAVHRAAALTRQMLDFTSKGARAKERIDLGALVDENIRLFRAGISKTITMTVSAPRGVSPIEADPGEVQQVVMNLITNAAESIVTGPGSIEVSVGERDYDEDELRRSRIDSRTSEGRFVFLEVADDGCGMDEETQMRMFEPFFTTKSTGRGLGMAALLGIVRDHSGAVFVASKVGAGTTIRVIFPAASGAAGTGAGRAARAGAAAQPDELAGKRVLIVDDEEIVRTVCAAMVERLGMRSATAADGEEALRLFRADPDRFDCAIIDLSMPRMDGSRCLEELRRIRPAFRAVLSSGYSKESMSARFSDGSVSGFIQKPYQLLDLSTVLLRLLRGGPS